MSWYEEGNGAEWNSVFLDLTYPYFLFYLVPSGMEDQRWGEGSEILLATITFLVEDTMTIRIDTTVVGPTGERLTFARSDAVTYIPRDNMPYYVNIRNTVRGDANGDQVINISDVMYMMNYLFRHGPPPVTFEAGDANCDNDHGILDVVFLINYLFKTGPPPSCS
ncbi:MAG: dockerin type I domain-containing protein [Candidatus Zixiibacteriota bacterium]